MYSVNWSTLSRITFEDETIFIIEKWNEQEGEKFGELVHSLLLKLGIHPEMGVFRKDIKIYSLVISKQTTLFYRIIENELKIELLLFWNNKQNPKLLDKFLK